MIEEKDLIFVGKFYKTHALKGELNVVTDGYQNEILDEGYPLIIDIDGIFVPFYVDSYRPKGMFGCLVRLDGVDDVEDASQFVNKLIYMRKKDVAEYVGVDEDELVREEDFIGYRIVVKNVGYVGRVMDIDTSTDNWLLIVQPDDTTADEIYIPFNEEFIREEIYDKENPQNNTLTLNIPDGIIDLNIKN